VVALEVDFISTLANSVLSGGRCVFATVEISFWVGRPVCLPCFMRPRAFAVHLLGGYHRNVFHSRHFGSDGGSHDVHARYTPDMRCEKWTLSGPLLYHGPSTI
jgi:hypothetical protein